MSCRAGKVPVPAHRGRIVAMLLGIALCEAGAQDGALRFRGDGAYESAYWGAVRAGEVPSLVFPLFGQELSDGADSGSTSGGPLMPAVALSASTPTFLYDTPFGDTSEISSPPSPRLPELQEAMAGLPSVFLLGLGLDVGRGLSARVDADLRFRRDWFAGAGSTLSWSGSDWGTGLIGDVEAPFRAWVSYGSPGVGAALGRFPSGIGAGHFGSTVLNPKAFYYDQAMAHLGDDTIRVAWMLGTSSPQLSQAEADVQWELTPEGLPGSGPPWDPNADHDYSDGRAALKMFAYHLLEWRPVKAIRLGLAEYAVMGGTVPALNFLLPGLVWHNTYAAGYSNVASAALASIVPVPGLLVSGEFLIDDTKSLDETAYDKPASWAWQLSASWAGFSGGGRSLLFGAEYSHVDRWTYVRWQPYLTMYQRNILPGGYRGIDTPLGYTYGPDCDQFGIWARFRTAGISLDCSWELVIKGPIYMGMIDADGMPVYFDYDKHAGPGKLDQILARPDEIRNVFRLSGTLPLWDAVSVRLEATLGFYRNFAHVYGDDAALAVVYLGLEWRPGGTAP